MFTRVIFHQCPCTYAWFPCGYHKCTMMFPVGLGGGFRHVLASQHVEQLYGCKCGAQRWCCYIMILPTHIAKSCCDPQHRHVPTRRLRDCYFCMAPVCTRVVIIVSNTLHQCAFTLAYACGVVIVAGPPPTHNHVKLDSCGHVAPRVCASYTSPTSCFKCRRFHGIP